MPFINSSNSFIPYHTGPYLQKGAGLFNVLGDLASRYVVPWMSKAAKTAASSLTSVATSKTAKALAQKASDAAAKGVLNTAQDIAGGKNVKEALHNNITSTKADLTDALKTEVSKAVKRKITPELKEPPKAKKPKVNKTPKKASKPKQDLFRTPSTRKSLL